MIRRATVADVPAILGLIRELAEFERELEAVVATEGDLRTFLFGSEPVAHCHVAQRDGVVVGMALWYRTFSTWQGRPGLWLEDLYVQPHVRGEGIGTSLLVELARVAVTNGWSRFEWWVLDWNTEAHGFYRSVGARPEDEWTVWRVDGEQLRQLAT